MAGRGAADWRESAVLWPRGATARGPYVAARAACSPSLPRLRGGRRVDELRIELCRYRAPRRYLCWSRPQGREAGRPAGHATDPVRACAQPDDRKNNRPRRSAHAARPRRRGHRMMRRREFIAGLGSAAAWPLGARAQQRSPDRMRRIGVLSNASADDPEAQARNADFLQRLQELGWTVGRNVWIDYRWGAGDSDQIRK